MTRLTTLIVLMMAAAPGWLLAGPPTVSVGAPTTAADRDLIQLVFPENMEVKVFIDYVARRLDMNILYDEAVVKRRVTISSHAKIPKDSLPGLFQNVLKISGLVLVDAGQPGWKRLVADQSLVTVTTGIEMDPERLAKVDSTTVITQGFELRHADPQAVTQSIKPFLSTPGGAVFTITTAEKKLLMITDYGDNIKRAATLIAMMDQPGRKAAVQFLTVKNRDCTEVAQRMAELLREKDRIASAGGKPSLDITVLPEPRTNQVMVISAEEAVAAEALDLLKLLDVPSGAVMQTYRFRYASPARIDKMAKDFAGLDAVKTPYSSTVDAESRLLVVTTLPRIHQHIEGLKEQLDVATDTQTRTYQFEHVTPERVDKLARDWVAHEPAGVEYKSSIDAESGLLVVTAPSQIHDRIEALKNQLDVGAPKTQTPIAFYKLVNSTASEVLATVRSLETGQEEMSGPKPPPWLAKGFSPATLVTPAGPAPQEGWTGPNRLPANPSQELPKPPGYREPAMIKSPTTSQPEGAAPGAIAAIRGRNAIVTADINTNTIIVIAPPEVQELYKKMIAVLDKRRPQVLIETTLVTLDTSGGYSVGVEMSYAQKNKYLVFSSFGLSTRDALTGALSITPGTGFNGALIDADTLNVVVRALTTDGRTTVVSAPRVLVNDNGTATLTSVNEAPFTSVNASNTVATTSFAGYATAGTTLTVTPHISEGDHLQLQYTVTLNSFTGQGSDTLPPPRQTNTVNSEVVVPDGHAVIVGGLRRKDASDSVSRVPGLGQIPLLEYAFSNRTSNHSESTLFVFVRPIILRDDAFEDLKYLSDRDAQQAGLPDGQPKAAPILME